MFAPSIAFPAAKVHSVLEEVRSFMLQMVSIISKRSEFLCMIGYVLKH